MEKAQDRRFMVSAFLIMYARKLIKLNLRMILLNLRCPYYLSREIHKDVDILFAPYNYLIDRGNRKSLKIDWNKCILIFDEAHNLVRKTSFNFWRSPSSPNHFIL